MSKTITREVDVEATVNVDISLDDLELEAGLTLVDVGDAKAPPPGLIDDMLRAARRYDREQFDQLASELYRSATV